ncbi:8090_t:CDS:2, partial [Paraglomus occultum]
TGTGAMGRHTKYGGYVIDRSRVRTYVVPRGLDEFQLRPYVSTKTPMLKYPMTPAKYFNLVKRTKNESQKLAKQQRQEQQQEPISTSIDSEV